MVADDVTELQLGAEEDRALSCTPIWFSVGIGKANGQGRGVRTQTCIRTRTRLVAIELDVDIITPKAVLIARR